MDTFTHINEPYGQVEFTIESIRPVQCPAKYVNTMGFAHVINQQTHNWVTLRGYVVKGSQTNRIGQHSRTTDLAGLWYSLDVSPDDAARGFRRTIAM